MSLSSSALIVRNIGCQPYLPIWRSMQTFTERRTLEDLDEFWVLEHPPVFTQGLAGKKEHVLSLGDIPLIYTDRGGQVTYHGPGQIVVYFLMDLTRRKWGPKRLVQTIENAVIAHLSHLHIAAHTCVGAPGVYVEGAKIASIGLRIRRGCSYHGLSFNVHMDLEPFSRIHPCGYPGLPITQLSLLGGPSSLEEVKLMLMTYLIEHLGYTHPLYLKEAYS
ncbi:MAG: lipoyl(octanoyl) transferase LipB [Gammaproteobacteria bacterium]|nr:lipoyl(octanoyl) transferase LipB [Gammaproteobacteria bacterium]